MAGEAFPIQESHDMRAPVAAAAAPISAQQLSGTGATGVENTTALRDGCMATLLNGATAIRFRVGTGTIEADTTDPILAAYGRLDWLVTAGVDDRVSVQAADGASAFEAHVWTSSGPRS